MTTNELQLAKAFRDAGFPQDKAEAVSETIFAIFAAIRDNVATKSDLQILGGELRREIQALKLWLGAGMVTGFVASFGLLFAALHLWPPHP